MTSKELRPQNDSPQSSPTIGPIENQIDDLSRIIQLQQKVATSQKDLNELMNLICQETQSLTKAEGAVVAMAEGDQMIYASCSGNLQTCVGLVLDIQSSLSGLAILSNQVLQCDDTETDIRVDREACRKVDARSMICVPLVHGEKAIGVLKVASTKTHAFQTRDRELLQLIAGLLSATIAQTSVQEALRASEQQAREATRMKSEFLANMSHEIRTPLNGVLGLATLLQNSPLSDEQKKYLDLLQGSAESLLSIINDILDISKIEAQKIEYEKIEFDLVKMLKNLSEISEYAARQKGIEFRTQISSDIPVFGIGDPTRTRQILNNLLTNALKFTRQGSILLKVEKRDDKIHFEVTDTGIGISEKSLIFLFQPFRQLDTSTTRQFGGTGLGLSICAQLVEGLGGKIGVCSVEGQGSSFWFELPLLRMPAGPANLTNEPGSLASPPRELNVLIAESNPTQLVVTEKLIESLGHRSFVAKNGYEVLAALAGQAFDLILMESSLRQLNGFETTRMIRRSSHPWKQIPIVATLSKESQAQRQDCLEAGMDAALSQPIDSEAIAQALQKIKPSRSIG